jgi:secreted effector protein SseD
MKKRIFLALTIALAGCQTGQLGPSAEANFAPANGKKTQHKLTKKETACTDAANKAAQSQANAALLGDVLSMAGGLGGLAGNGGVIAGQAASIGGSVLQSQATAKARAGVAENCYG